MRSLARPLPRLVLVLVTAAVISVPSGTAGAATGDRFRLDFDEGQSLAVGTKVTDVSGLGNGGVVRSSSGGVITPAGGRAVYPRLCTTEPCPNAIIEIADSPQLDPGTAPFEYGATVVLAANQTSTGQNIIQKGTFDASGQWKLQVDNIAGQPSCRIRGFNGSHVLKNIRVVSSVSIADGQPHQVMCRKTSTGLQILIDGVGRGTSASGKLDITNSSSVTVGGRNTAQNNDQFQGALDDVYMRLI